MSFHTFFARFVAPHTLPPNMYKATACFFFFSRYTRSLIFPNSRKKTHEKKHKMQRFAQPCVWAIEHDSSRTAAGWFSFFFCLLVACRNCSRAGPLPCRRWYEDRDLPRKVWNLKRKLHILLGKFALDWCNIDREVPNIATLAWWLITRTSRKRCCRRVELAGEAECLFFWSFVFFYLAPSLIFLIHVTRTKEKTHCGLSNLPLSQSCQSHSWRSQLAKRRIFSCVVLEQGRNSCKNVLKSGVTPREVGFHKSTIVFLPEHISQTSPLPDEEGGSSHLL